MQIPANSRLRIGYGRLDITCMVSAVKRPTFQRNSPKVRKVQPPPNGIDLTQVARSCRYVGSPYHKDALSPSDGSGPP